MPQERIIVSVGGSLIVPDAIDTHFLSSFRSLILEKIPEGFSFFIITGGGKTARRYQDAAKDVYTELPADDADWIGIHATRLNAHLVRTVFRDQAEPRVEKDPTQVKESTHGVMVGAGWKPGNSTDLCAVEVAKTLGAKKLINLSNIDYVYTADPRTNPEAQKIEKINWADFRKLLPEEWSPGLSSPFDPVAAKEAERLGLEVAVINGNNLEEFSNYLDGKAFKGTLIS